MQTFKRIARFPAFYLPLLLLPVVSLLAASCSDDSEEGAWSDVLFCDNYCKGMQLCSDCTFDDAGHAACASACEEEYAKLSEESIARIVTCADCVMESISDVCDFVNIADTPCAKDCASEEVNEDLGLLLGNIRDRADEADFLCHHCSSERFSENETIAVVECVEGGNITGSCECTEGEKKGHTFELENACSDEAMQSVRLETCI